MWVPISFIYKTKSGLSQPIPPQLLWINAHRMNILIHQFVHIEYFVETMPILRLVCVLKAVDIRAIIQCIGKFRTSLRCRKINIFILHYSLVKGITCVSTIKHRNFNRPQLWRGSSNFLISSKNSKFTEVLSEWYGQLRRNWLTKEKNTTMRGTPNPIS